MRCQYCFYADETRNRQVASFGLMDPRLLEKIVEKAIHYADSSITFAFQGGEPTLAGLDFYKALIALEKKYNHKNISIRNALQTNGYIINDEWAAFFTENRFLVGLSIDGTKEIHNLYRYDVDGNGTHNRVMQAARLFKKHDVNYNILTVVTAQAARHIHKIYSFYRHNNMLYQQYIPCLDPLDSLRGANKYSLTPELYQQFLINLFDLWYDDLMNGRFIFIRYFENLVGMLKGYPPESCGMTGQCSAQNVIEADGGVYPCDYYVLDDCLLGNLANDSFENIEKRRKEIRFIEQSMKLDNSCLSCRWEKICRGGCRRDRITDDNGEVGQNYFWPA